MAGPSAEQRVTVPTLKTSWLATAFVHWRVPSARIQSLLPQGLTVDEYDGWAWVGLVPFVMAGMRPAGLPDPSGAFARLAAIRGMSRVPDPSTTPETNLRTYVRGPDGRDGLWFFSLDVGNAALAVALRGLVGAPYHVGRLVVDRHDDVVTYTGSRVGGGQSYHLVVRPAAEIRPSALEAWLTGRWRAYTWHLGRLLVTPVEHEPWPLQAARLDALEQNLTGSVDLGALTDPPLAHFSAGVRHVRVGFPRLVERRTDAQGADT